MKKTLHRLWHQAWATILVEMTDQEIGWLVSARNHISLLEKRRTAMVISRVRLIAGLFALLTPMWIVVDIAAFPREVWLPLAVARIVATAAFVLLLVTARRSHTIWNAYWALAALMAIPTAFFLFSHQHMMQFELEGLQAAVSTGYGFLPFVMLAGLSIFPLTLLEAVIFISPLLGMEILGSMTSLATLDWPTFAASFWLMVLIAGVSTLAGLSQLAFVIVLVREAIRDGMTGCFSRQSGEELMELQFILSNRSGSALTAVFIDLDHFKQVNDRFGHDAGDRVLVTAVESVRSHLRMGDMLTRWGGEEFLLIMPNTTAPMACKALTRVRQTGLGVRPDGTPITASIGVAERIHDGAEDWRQLVEIADKRMYTAKQGGRNRVVGCEN